LLPGTEEEQIKSKTDGRFDKADFIYDGAKNEFRCPAGQALIWRFSGVENGMTNRRYWGSNCTDVRSGVDARRASKAA
jgi:transposase